MTWRYTYKNTKTLMYKVIYCRIASNCKILEAIYIAIHKRAVKRTVVHPGYEFYVAVRWMIIISMNLCVLLSSRYTVEGWGKRSSKEYQYYVSFCIRRENKIQMYNLDKKEM